MYLDFYGLSEAPFDLTPNPRFLFLAPVYREALSNLRYGIESGKGLTLLIGEAGTGKTTLIRKVLNGLGEGAYFLYINNPTLSREEFVELLARGFALSPEARTSKARMLIEIEQALRDRRGKGQHTALVVDEAQSLPDELLEEIRLLANVETDDHKLLPVVLAGQPELAARLNRPELRQLKQRVALRCELKPLDLHETAAYIASRIRTAGGDSARLFTREAVAAIHEGSQGIPRLVSVICDNALVTGFAMDRKPVTRNIVLDVCRDFDLQAADPASEAAPRVAEVMRPEVEPVVEEVANAPFRFFGRRS